jgi:hypothetical protein
LLPSQALLERADDSGQKLRLSLGERFPSKDSGPTQEILVLAENDRQVLALDQLGLRIDLPHHRSPLALREIDRSGET